MQLLKENVRQKCYRYGRLAVAFWLASTASMVAHASDGQLNVAASVAATTCQISGMSGTNNFTVPMPTVSTATLAQPGAVAGITRVDINLTNCAPATGKGLVHAYFEPGPTVDLPNGNLIPETGPGAAGNIEVALLTNMLSKIHVGATDPTAGYVNTIIQNGSAQITFYAEYIAHGGPASPGTVNTSVVYDLSYN
jgi:major type 1 subunit fimbrin (pilin)